MPDKPYQVSADDKDFLTLSANLGVDYQALRAANPYVQSLSQGQFINVPSGTLTGASALGTDPGAVASFEQAVIPRPTNLASGTGGASGTATLRRAAAPPVTPNAQANEWLARVSGKTPAKPAGNTPYTDYAQRAGAQALNADAALNQFATTGTLPAGLNQNVINFLISQGADPALVQKAMVGGAQAEAFSNDPLAGTPGHYYVDEKTAPFVGQNITLKDGSKRLLLSDKNGRLYYAQPGQSKYRQAKRRYRNRERDRQLYAPSAEQIAAQQAADAAILAAQQAAELAAQVRGDSATTTLSVILGS
ncbi:MAG: hypothetical protein EHM40_02825 [Chloroflexi bacterium]|nr:MAG: hypothetical protein EHM40_02825 [Chloroflexota bacterium]